MNVEVNYVAILLAVISSMIVGSIWYALPVFGTRWMKLARVDQKEASKNGWRPIVIAIVTSAATAFVLAHVAYLSNYYFGNSFLQDSLTTAFWLWLGLTAARFVAHDAFECRPLKLTIINVAHEFVTVMVMGAIIGAFGI